MNKARNAPFKWNIAALTIIPIGAIKAATATDQIDMLYAVADDPATDPDRASALARLAGKCMDKLRNRN